MFLCEIKDTRLRKQYKKMQRQVALPPRAGRKDKAAETLAERVRRRHAEAKEIIQKTGMSPVR